MLHTLWKLATIISLQVLSHRVGTDSEDLDTNSASKLQMLALCQQATFVYCLVNIHNCLLINISTFSNTVIYKVWSSLWLCVWKKQKTKDSCKRCKWVTCTLRLRKVPTFFLTFNAPLILKMRDIIFFLRANYIMGHFKGYFEGAKTFLTPPSTISPSLIPPSPNPPSRPLGQFYY